jgi:hypothetical protein
MTDIVGTLGEQTGATVGTHTLYTCPSGKGARGKIMYRGVAGNNSTILFTVNGIILFQSAALVTGHIVYTTTLLMFNDAATAATITGATDALTVANGPKEYFVSEGETITYTIGTTDFSSFKAVFVGAEVDNS